MTKKITFGYQNFPFGGRNIRRPVAQFLIENDGRKQSFHCLIDSGADESMSFVEIGKEFGLDFTDAERSYASGIGGDDTLCFKKHILIHVGNRSIPILVLWQNRKMDPSKDFPFVIGRLVFFDKFDVIFEQSKDKFHLKPIPKSRM